MSADNIGSYSQMPNGVWICWMSFMSDDDQRPFVGSQNNCFFATEQQCLDHFRNEEANGCFYEYGWGRFDWNGWHGDAVTPDKITEIANSLDDSADWLQEHSHHMSRAVLQGYASVVDSLRAHAQKLRLGRD